MLGWDRNRIIRSQSDAEAGGPPPRCCVVTALTAASRDTRSAVHVHAPGQEERRRVAAALYASGWMCVPDGEQLRGTPAFAVCWMSGVDDGLADLRILRERLGDIPIVAVLSGRLRPARLRKMLRTGADGIVLERDVDRALSAVVEVVLLGQVVAPKELTAAVVGEALTFRERQILGLVVLGFTNRQIADKLFLAESTVKTHLSSAFAKLEAHSRAEAAAMMLDPEDTHHLALVPARPDLTASAA